MKLLVNFLLRYGQDANRALILVLSVYYLYLFIEHFLLRL